MGKFAKALGVLDLNIGGVEFTIRPVMGDNRKLMRIMMNDAYKNDSAGRMEAFAEYITNIIKRDNPDEPENEIKQFVEFNINKLFEEILVAFNWTTREDLEKSKKEALGDIKNLIERS